MKVWQGSKRIRPEKRVRIYARDGWRCLWCGTRAGWDEFLTLDHYVPRSKGGTNEASNLVTSCKTCNSRRQNMDALDFAFVIRPLTCFRSAERVIVRVLSALAKDLPGVPA